MADKALFKEPSLSREWKIWLVIHLVAWTFLPLLSNAVLHFDTIEALVWGKEWAWGYDKHPPLSAWAAEIFGYLPGDWGLYFLSQFCIVVAGCGVLKLGKDFGLSKSTCFLGVIFLDAIYFYQYVSPEFNVNYLQLPFWVWGWWAGFRGVKTGKLLYWAGLGLAVGLGALTKYLAVFLLVPFFVALYEQKRLFEQLRRPGIYLAGVVSILVFLPHLLWMKNNDWMTITYGLMRAEEEGLSFLVKRILYPLEFLGSQFAILLPLLLFTIWNRSRSGGKVSQVPVGLRGLSLGGFAFIALLAIVFGWRPVMMWVVPMPLAIVLWAASKVAPEKQRRAAWCALGFGLIGLTAYVGVYALSPRFRERPHRVGYPGPELALQVETLWERESEEPLEYIVSEAWLGGLVAWYGEDRPSVLIEGVWKRSRYLDPEEVKEAGAVILWLKSLDASFEKEKEKTLEEAMPDVMADFSKLEFREDLLILWPGRTDGKKGRYGVAVALPQGE